MKRLVFFLALLGLAAPSEAQFTITHVFSPGTPILASEVNANFDLLADAVNRTGGTITGNIAVDPNITIDGVDISDFLQSTGEVRSGTLGTVALPAFSRVGDEDTGMWFPASGSLAWSLDGVERMRLSASGLTVFGTNIINSSGKIPGFTSTYFSSLDGSAITNVSESSIIDGSVFARLASDETITGSWTHNIGTIVADKHIVDYTATWNNAATVFTGVQVSVTNTASAAGSKPVKVSVGGSEKFSIGVDGTTSMSTFQMTTGASNGYVLTSDGSGNASWQSLPAGTTGVPTGMVAMFESACPSGWTRRSGTGETYENKFVRGGATYSAAGGGSDTHSHTIDPPNTTSTAAGAHTHTVDIPSTSSSTDGAHSHSITGSTGSTDITHTHTFTTGGPSSSNFFDSGGAFGAASDSHTHSGTTDPAGGSHSHTAGTLHTTEDGAHSHTFDPAPVTTSGVSGLHTHDVNISSFSSGSASNVPAYVQVIFCKKD